MQEEEHHTSTTGKIAVSTQASRVCKVRGTSGRSRKLRSLPHTARSVTPRPNARTIISARNIHAGAPKPGSTMAATCRTIHATTR